MSSLRARMTVVTLAAVACAMLVGSAIWLVSDTLLAYREHRLDLSLLAEQTAYHSQSPLSFLDRGSALETLRSVRAHPSVQRACVLDLQGLPFVCLGPDQVGLADVAPPAGQYGYDNGVLRVAHAVGSPDVVGTVVIEADLLGVKSRQLSGLALLMAAWLAALLVSVVLSVVAHRFVAGPVVKLASVIDRIRDERRYDLRVDVAGVQEIRVVAHAFNEMMVELGRRDTELIEARQLAEQNVIMTRLALDKQQSLEQELVHVRKMESIGQLAGGIAHDFNNLLTVIIGGAEMAQMGLEPNHPVQRDVEMIITGASRAGELTRRLLAFARKQHIVPKLVDVAELMRESGSLVQRLLPENIELVMNLSEGEHCATVDPGQLQQVLINLAVNARDAMADGGRLELRLSTVQVGSDERRMIDGILVAGKWVLIEVQDQGSGISDDVLSRIFEPFFTTKPTGKGTGMGLATCYGIVRQAGGNLSVNTQVGFGTTFSAYLPWDDQRMEASSEVGQELTHARGHVMLVEDEESVRHVLSQQLERAGFQVNTAVDGEDALKKLRAGAVHRIDVLVTDVVMPGMGGHALAERALALRGDLSVIFISGYDPTAGERGPLEHPFLQKPFRPADLVRLLETVIQDGENRQPRVH